MFAKTTRSFFLRTAARLSNKLNIKGVSRPIATFSIALASYASYIKTFNNTEEWHDVSVCDEGDMSDGQMKEFQVGPDEKNDIILVVKLDGQYFAVGAKCTHFGMNLAKGMLFGDRIYCPLHMASFSVRDGQPDFGPVFKGLPSYKVKIVNGKVTVTVPRKIEMRVDVPSNQKRNLFKDKHFIIVGGGPAGLSAAETLRQAGFGGKLTLITKEDRLPYDRTILTKNLFKVQEKGIRIREQEFFNKYNIEVMTGTEVTNLDDKQQKLSLNNSQTLSYDKVLVATGGSPVQSRFDTGNIKGVFTIRDLDNVENIQNYVKDRQIDSIVVVGSSFISSEAAASARAFFKDAQINMVSRQNTLYSRIFGQQIGDFVKGLASQNNVNLIGNTSVERVITDKTTGEVKEVVLSNGESIPANLVLYGFGIKPNTSFMSLNQTDSSGLIPVNNQMQSLNNKTLYAAGDVASLNIGSETRNIQHYNESISQGSLAAWNMLEKNVDYDIVPFFWSRLYNTSVCFTGNPQPNSDIVLKGDMEKKSFMALYCKDDLCHAGAGSGSSHKLITLNQALSLGLPISRSKFLEDENYFKKLQVEILKNVRSCHCNRKERNDC